MKTKTPRVYTLDELKEKCQQALIDPKLVEIVKTAPLNNGGKVNLSWVYKEAEKYVHEQTKDLKKTKELSVATRFLAMLRRDHAEEFEKILQGIKRKEKSNINTTWSDGFKDFKLGGSPAVTIAFKRIEAWFFSRQILEALIENSSPEEYMCHPKKVRDYLIQLLEEKFGLRIEVCGNCKYFYFRISGDSDGDCHREITREPSGVPQKTFGHCVYWTLKEFSEKKES